MSKSQYVLTILPALVVGILFEAFLGHRHDYTGHYLAGYGGTLGALMMSLKALPSQRFALWGAWLVAVVSVGCIGLGMITEATIFRIAKFDEVDFFNQSLGAVLAGIVTLAFVQESKPADRAFYEGLIVAIVFLSLGGCYAVA